MSAHSDACTSWVRAGTDAMRDFSSHLRLLVALLGYSSHLSTMNTLASLARSICEAVVQHQSHVEAPARLRQLSIKLQRNRELFWPY